jgi:hypothetical protein
VVVVGVLVIVGLSYRKRDQPHIPEQASSTSLSRSIVIGHRIDLTMCVCAVGSSSVTLLMEFSPCTCNGQLMYDSEDACFIFKYDFNSDY